MPRKKLTVAIAGNPNSGKTTIFNHLTGARHRVGNWAGVTVEKKEGFVSYKGYDLTFVDLPGTYSLTAYSVEEVIARNFILDESPDIVLNILDAANLERNLFMPTQLVELEAKVLFVLNMVDTAEKRGISIDEKKFSEFAGTPVIKTIGNKNKGINKILDEVIELAEKKGTPKSHMRLKYCDEVENALGSIQKIISLDKEFVKDYPLRWLSLKLLEGDKEERRKLKGSSVEREVLEQVSKSTNYIERVYEEELSSIIARQSYGFIHGLCREVVHSTIQARIILSDKIDFFLTSRLLGIPIFLGIMWLMFKATFTFGELPMSWIESFFGAASSTAQAVLPAGLLKDLVINGVIAGIGGIMVFLPNILILFLFISFFEDTGYMARAAFIMDRLMRSIGLHGKSFIPLIMGFGCNVPAIMATRTLETRRDRILSILINPYISCNARLPIYVLFVSAFFADNKSNVIFSLYMLGICVAIFSGMLFRRLFFPGDSEPFVMELPPYRLPTLKSTAIHMWEKSVIFIKKIWRVIIAGSIVIWFLGNFPQNIKLSRDYDSEILSLNNKIQTLTPGSEYNSKTLAEKVEALSKQKDAERVERTYIGQLGKFMEPVFRPLGFDWRNSVALVCGFVAKEIVVSTHGVLFKLGEDASEESGGLVKAIKNSHMTPLTAYAFMAFTLLYTPCLATIGIIKKETGSWKWTAFSITYSLCIAWIVAFAIFHGGLFIQSFLV